MKRKICSILLIVCMMLVLPIPKRVQATTATKELTEGKEYKVDLDGDGKKESVKLVTKESGNRNTFKIYINGKKKYSYTYDNEHCWTGQIGYTDLNKRDYKKEIFATFITDNANLLQIRMFQYKSGTIKMICVSNAETDDQPFGRGVRIAPTQKGDGTVTLDIDTPYDKGSLGCYYLEMLFSIKSGRLVKNKQATYKVEQNWKKQKYTLTKKITFTTTPGGKKKAFTIKKGTTVYLNRMYCKSEKATSYIEIRTKAGKTGWMKVTNSRFYKQNYAWD